MIYMRLLARELRLDAAGQLALLEGTTLTPADLFQLDELAAEGDRLQLLRNALRLAGRPGWGLEVGSRWSLAAHGPLGQLLSASASLGEAWEAVERYHGLRLSLLRLSRRLERDHLCIHIDLQHPLDDVGLFLIEAMMVTVQGGIELITGRRLKEAQLHFAYPAPAHAELYAQHLHGTCHFSSGQTLVKIPRELLDLPNPFRDPLLWAQALQQCEALEASLKHSVTWVARITQLLQQHPGQLWTLTDVATHFHLSPRTLMRHLKSEGSSYQQVLDAELERQAKQHLASSRYTVESVALALGYQDATAFRRAFRRWSGESPSAWQAAQQQR
jgi:AraC-like DNA-binding protein